MKSLTLSLVLIVLAGGQPEYVDSAPATLAADGLYAALGEGDIGLAMDQFAPNFRLEVEIWPKFLASMDQRFGPVTSKVLRENQLAANEREPCFILTYSVSRAKIDSIDKLFVCRVPNDKVWKIYGHHSTRMDTGQTLRGGLMPLVAPTDEKGASTP
jgi:hypothetical protein